MTPKRVTLTINLEESEAAAIQKVAQEFVSLPKSDRENSSLMGDCHSEMVQAGLRLLLGVIFDFVTREELFQGLAILKDPSSVE